MENAMRIKEWCSKELSPMAWPLIAMRALPEIMATGNHVSLIDINEQTIFEPELIDILAECIHEAYQVRIPEEVIKGDTNPSIQEEASDENDTSSVKQVADKNYDFVDKETEETTPGSLLGKTKAWFGKTFKN